MTADLIRAARHVVAERDRYGWSPEADAAISALRATLAQSPAEGDDILEPLIYAAMMHNGTPKTVAEFERAAANVTEMLERRGTAQPVLEALERIADPRNTHFAGDAQVVARDALKDHSVQAYKMAKALADHLAIQPAQAPAPAPEAASAARPFSAVKSFSDSVLAMLDERIKAADRSTHPFNDYFGDKPETIVAAKAQASELREVRTQVRILGDRALVDLMKFKPAISAPAVGADVAPVLRRLVEQIDKAVFVDENGHPLKMNAAYLAAKEAL